MIGTFFTTYLVFEKGLNEELSSLIYGSSHLMGIISAPIGGLLAYRFGEKRWLLVSLLLAYISLSLSLASPNVITFVSLFLSYGFCTTLGMAANSAIMARLSPSRRLGLGYSLFFLPGSVMGAFAPIIAAYVANLYGLGSIFIVALALYFIGLAVFKFGVKL
jgi:MFS family permease